METRDNNGKNVAESGLFKKFLSRAEEYLKKPSRVKDLLSDTYKKASEKKDVGTLASEVWESLQTLSRLIKAAVSGEYTGIPTATIVGGIAVLLYFLSPIDLVPDFLPVIGLLDDVALLAWFMSSIKAEMDKFNEWEKTARAPKPETATAGVTTDKAGVTPKYEHRENRDPNQAPAPGQVKDFPAHDLEVNLSPDESAIRAAASGSGEPNVRAATTDSTRIPSSNDDDLKAGGNIR
ncbi:MAG: YkvA family protein [Adhaeribacter sp.]